MIQKMNFMILADDDFDEDQMLNKKKDGARIIFEAVTSC